MKASRWTEGIQAQRHVRKEKSDTDDADLITQAVLQEEDGVVVVLLLHLNSKQAQTLEPVLSQSQGDLEGILEQQQYHP